MKQSACQHGLLRKLTVAMLALAITVVFMPVFAFAAETGAAKPINVTMTVSLKGELAKAKDGSMMAMKKVTVEDLDENGEFTYDEALVAAHKAYNAPEGYDNGGGYVQKLWGEAGVFLFFANNQGIPNGVTVDTVSDGDELVAAVLADDATYSDWYTSFDKKDDVKTTTGKAVSLTLKGHLGMAWQDEDKKDVPLADMQVGYYKDGVFTPLNGVKTDAEGKCSVTFDKAGTYVVSAKGQKAGVEVTDWSLIGFGNNNTAPFGGYTDYSNLETWVVAYTDKDYGDGPYPKEEVKYIGFFEEAVEPSEDSDVDYVWQNLHYLKSNQVLVAAPTIAPACIITVEEAKQDPVIFFDPPQLQLATSVTLTGKTLTAKAVAKAVKKAGGTKDSVTSFVLGKKVKTIKAGAFAGYGKATTLVVKSKKLTKKSVKGSLKKSNIKKIKVKVGNKKLNKKYVKKYKKIFTKKNAGKKAKVTL